MTEERKFAILEAANARQSPETLMDYADSNFRYLRLTGLFKGKRLGLAPHRRTLIDGILARPFEPRDGKHYLAKLWQGAELPTDNRETAIAEARETAAALETAGVAVRLPPRPGPAQCPIFKDACGVHEFTDVERNFGNSYAFPPYHSRNSFLRLLTTGPPSKFGTYLHFSG